MRNLVKTVNSLPPDFKGKLDVLLNDINPIVTNRNLLVLYVLSAVRPERDAAELALHIMYSSAI